MATAKAAALVCDSKRLGNDTAAPAPAGEAAPAAAGAAAAAAATAAAVAAARLRAAEDAQLADLQRLDALGWRPGPNACAQAARKGHLRVLQWVRARGAPWDAETAAAAVSGGHKNVLEWVHSEGCPWDESACAKAGKKGRLGLLRWLRARGCPWDALTCTLAARGGHLATLRWAREHGCPWSESTCAWAAGHGRLRVVRWLRANGCPWDADACHNAARGGHYALLHWLRSQGCPEDSTRRPRPSAPDNEGWPREGWPCEGKAWTAAPGGAPLLASPEGRALMAAARQDSAGLSAELAQVASVRPLIELLKNVPNELELVLKALAALRRDAEPWFYYFTEVRSLRTFDLYCFYRVEPRGLYQSSVSTEQWEYLLRIGYVAPGAGGVDGADPDRDDGDGCDSCADGLDWDASVNDGDDEAPSEESSCVGACRVAADESDGDWSARSGDSRLSLTPTPRSSPPPLSPFPSPQPSPPSGPVVLRALPDLGRLDGTLAAGRKPPAWAARD